MALFVNRISGLSEIHTLVTYREHEIINKHNHMVYMTSLLYEFFLSGILLLFLAYFYVSIVLILYQDCDFTRIDILRLLHTFYVYLLVIDITNENRRSILNSIPIENKKKGFK